MDDDELIAQALKAGKVTRVAPGAASMDWREMRARAHAVRQEFTAGRHIGRLIGWLDRHYPA